MLDTVRHNFDMLEEFKASHSTTCQRYLKAKVDAEAHQDMVKIVDKEVERLEQDLRAKRKRLRKEQNYLLTLAR